MDVWHCTPAQVIKLESLQLTAARHILQCPTSISSFAVRQELCLEPLETRRTRSRLKMHNRMFNMPESRFPHQLLRATWTQVVAVPMWNNITARLWRSLPTIQQQLTLPLEPKLFLEAIELALSTRDNNKFLQALQSSSSLQLHYATVYHETGGFPHYLRSLGSLGATSLMFQFRCMSHPFQPESNPTTHELP